MTRPSVNIHFFKLDFSKNVYKEQIKCGVILPVFHHN